MDLVAVIGIVGIVAIVAIVYQRMFSSNVDKEGFKINIKKDSRQDESEE
jgi:FtsZ-interacting cell division protein ZipA